MAVALDATPASAAGARPRPEVGGLVARGGVLAAVAAVVVLTPFALDPVASSRLTEAVAYAIIGVSLNVLLGYIGQISLGHAAFVGIGALTSAYVVSVQGQSIALGIVAAAAVGGLQAGVLGLMSLRVTGLYFALITLAYAEFARETLFKVDAITGGGAGREAPNPFGPSAFRSYYYLALALLAVVLYVDRRLVKSKGGRALLALRENPRVAASLGVNVRLFTLLGFVISGAFAGIGGAILGHNVGQVSADTYTFQLGLLFVLMTVVGGLRNRTGVVIGSVLFGLLSFLIEELPGVKDRFVKIDSTGLFLAFLVGVALVIRVGVVALRRKRLDVRLLVAGAVLAVVAGAILLPGSLGYDLPGRLPHLALEATINEAPGLSPEIGRLVLGPLLLLLTLTTLPGGIGQLVTPVVQWLAGGRFDAAAGRVKEVQITDVRA